MAFIDGDDPINGSLFSFQEWERMKNNWRGAVVPTNAQPGMIFSDSDDDELYMMATAALQRIIKENSLGKVGIGTLNPQGNLHINGTNAKMIIEDPANPMYRWAFQVVSARGGEFEFCQVSGSKLAFVLDVNGNVNIGSSSTGLPLNPPLYVKSGGNVGIKTTNPTETLEIVGNLKISAGKINIVCLDNNIICINNDVVLF